MTAPTLIGLAPMLLTEIPRPFSREGWTFELKYDGWRCLAEIRDGDVRLASGDGEAWLQWASSLDGLTMTIEDGWVSPSYGVRAAIRVVVLKGRVALPRSISYRFGRSRLRLDRLAGALASLPSDTPGQHVLAPTPA